MDGPLCTSSFTLLAMDFLVLVDKTGLSTTYTVIYQLSLCLVIVDFLEIVDILCADGQIHNIKIPLNFYQFFLSVAFSYFRFLHVVGLNRTMTGKMFELSWTCCSYETLFQIPRYISSNLPYLTLGSFYFNVLNFDPTC